MNEATWIIIIGLGLDIVGALLIVGPLRHRKYLFKRLNEILKEIFEAIAKSKEGKIEEISPQSNRERIDQLAQAVNDRFIEELQGFKKFYWGIALLVLGFILQIIGNWFQNPPFIIFP